MRESQGVEGADETVNWVVDCSDLDGEQVPNPPDPDRERLDERLQEFKANRPEQPKDDEESDA